jgi:hypothetical protein
MIFAQKPQNSIFIWDVTASMVGTTNSTPPDYGYKADADIDKEVRAGLKKIINGISENSGEIIILPFGTNIWEIKRFNSNMQGKENAINYINNYNISKRPAGYTNICGSWDNAMQYVDSQKENLIYIFTDGEQNIAYGPHGNNCLGYIVEDYCRRVKNTNAFTFFISLNIDERSFSDVLNNACAKHLKYVPLTEVKGSEIQPPISLVAKFNPLTINLNDEHPVATERFEVKGGNVPENFKMAIRLEGVNHPLDLLASVIKSDETNFDVQFSLEDIDGKTITALKNNKSLNLNGEILIEDHDGVSFEPSVLHLYIINKEAQKLIFKIN